MGGGVNYRMYKNEGGKGVFYGPFAKINMVSWDYEYYDFYYWIIKDKDYYSYFEFIAIKMELAIDSLEN